MKITFDHLSRYAMALFAPFQLCLIEKNAGGAVAIVVGSFFFPPLLILFPPYLLMITHQQIKKEHELQQPERMGKVVLCIQMNHLQTLTEIFEDDPELLTQNYKKKSLHYWCKHYNNTKAHALILELAKQKTSAIQTNSKEAA